MFTHDQIRHALNVACDDIIDAAELPDTGTVDALNLLVNATLHYLDWPDAADTLTNLDAVAEFNYGKPLREILDDIQEA